MGELIKSYRTENCEWGTNPGKPAPGVMQVFVKDGVPDIVDFLCPCGCGNTCPTSLKKPGKETVERPRWEFSMGPNGPTLVPSIRWDGGCKAHFTITDGKVTMHEDSGR